MRSWQDLQTKGYLVIPQALTPELVEALVADFQRGTPPEKYPHGFKLVSRRALNKVKPLIESFLEAIRSETTLEVDTINFLTYSHYVTTELADKVSAEGNIFARLWAEISKSFAAVVLDFLSFAEAHVK